MCWAICSSDHSCQCCSTSASRCASGKRFNSAINRSVCSSRPMTSLGVGSPADNQASNLNDDSVSRSSSDRSRRASRRSAVQRRSSSVRLLARMRRSHASRPPPSFANS